MIKLPAYYFMGEIMGDAKQDLSTLQQDSVSPKQADICDLIFADQLSANHDALKKKLLKKYWQNIKPSIAESLTENSDNDCELNFPRFKKSDSLDAKLEILRESTNPVVQQAFKQAIFDVYRANQIKGGVSQTNIENIVAAADKLKVDYPSKYATQHKTKTARKREVEFLKECCKGKALTRTDVIRIIKLADFNKQPRDLSDLNLSGCDLSGLDLRKTKFDGATMNAIKIDQFTKFKSATFNGVKMQKLQIIDSKKIEQEPITFDSSVLLNNFKKEYKKLRETRVKKFGEKLISNFLLKLKTGEDESTTNDFTGVAEDLLNTFAHSKLGNRTSQSLHKTIYPDTDTTNPETANPVSTDQPAEPVNHNESSRRETGTRTPDSQQEPVSTPTSQNASALFTLSKPPSEAGDPPANHNEEDPYSAFS